MNGLRTSLTLLLLLVAAFCLALTLSPWAETLQTGRRDGLLSMLLGDGRRLFANHFFAKADATYHQGVYPSIFDPPRREEMHMVTATVEPTHPPPEEDPEEGHAHDDPTEPEEDHTDEHDPEQCDDPTHNHAAAEVAPDWIAWVNSRLHPSDHAHLVASDKREMLPWLLMAAELDPENAHNFVITAYWLRNHLGHSDQAEQFLREGLRHNPDNPDILFTLGIIQQEDRQAVDRARNLYTVALEKWRATGTPEKEPDPFLGESILLRLARLEESAGQIPAAIEYLRELIPISPNPDIITAQIAELESGLAPAQPPP